MSADRITDRDDPVLDPARFHPDRQIQHLDSDISGASAFRSPPRSSPASRTGESDHARTFVRNGHRLLSVLTGCGQVTQAAECLGMLDFHMTGLQRVISFRHFFNGTDTCGHLL